ncbi:helix-turn-helix transcriptional regulator [Kitasatospora sp. NPDC092948]|uniref:helix-turn-helix transcriptional regulator n=1 Tax=Kitasatospora sp. NPDC092948 TaxID=3364088 RepID=UPI003802F9DE
MSPARGSRRTPTEQQLEQRARFGRRLRQLRVARDLSQERLAELAGLDRQTIGYWERARTNPGLDEITAVAGALDVDLWQLFVG